MEETAKKLLKYIEKSTSPYHVADNSCNMLRENGFEELIFSENWSLKEGGKYYTKPYGTTVFAFTIGSMNKEKCKIRMASAHTDYPCFRVKPNPEIIEKKYLQLNVEAYGGMILNTWLDRPLSLAGKVTLRSKDIFKPDTQLIDIKEPLLTIPNLAIHMNREVNKGVALNKQTEMEPVIGIITEELKEKNFLTKYLAEKINRKAEEILDFDLYVYNAEKGCTLGMNKELISSPRLDNQTSCYALLDGIIKATDHEKNLSDIVRIIALYDNEEVGSRSKQGADSMISNILIEKIISAFDMNRTDAYNAILRGTHFSVDVAHGLHPNYASKNDPTNETMLGGGVVVKIDTSQRYASDTESVGIFEQLCLNADIKYQKFVNRSDSVGGSTLGSIASSWLPMKTTDLGIPLLAMHSARELMAISDQKELNRLMEQYFLTDTSR